MVEHWSVAPVTRVRFPLATLKNIPADEGGVFLIARCCVIL